MEVAIDTNFPLDLFSKTHFQANKIKRSSRRRAGQVGSYLKVDNDRFTTAPPLTCVFEREE